MDRDDAAPRGMDPRRTLLDRLTEPVSPVDALAILRDLARPAEPPPEASGEADPPDTTTPDTPPPNRGNYLGDGLYVFQGAEAKKLIVYVDPAVYRDAKVAAARAGRTLSETVNTALRGAGFGNDDEATVRDDEV